MTRELNLHIDELVLHGFAPGDGHRIGVAFQAELERLIREQGVPQNVYTRASMPTLQADSISLRPHGTAAATGAEIGRAVYRGIAQAGVRREALARD